MSKTKLLKEFVEKIEFLNDYSEISRLGEEFLDKLNINWEIGTSSKEKLAAFLFDCPSLNDLNELVVERCWNIIEDRVDSRIYHKVWSESLNIGWSKVRDYFWLDVERILDKREDGHFFYRFVYHCPSIRGYLEEDIDDLFDCQIENLFISIEDLPTGVEIGELIKISVYKTYLIYYFMWLILRNSVDLGETVGVYWHFDYHLKSVNITDEDILFRLKLPDYNGDDFLLKHTLTILEKYLK